MNEEFLAVLESGENSKMAIIIPYGTGNTTVPPITYTVLICKPLWIAIICF